MCELVCDSWSVMLFIMLFRFPNFPAAHAYEQSFMREPTDQSVTQGSALIIPCRVKNKTGVLQWTRDGFGLGTEADLPGFDRYSMIINVEEGDYTLSIKHVTLEDDAKFQCQVGPADNVAGIRSQIAQITVFVEPEAPVILQGTNIHTVANDKEIELECVCRGGKPAATLTWMDGKKNEMTAESTTEKYAENDKRENAKSLLKFKPTREHHNQTLTCQAHNPALSEPLEAGIHMLVEYPPEVSLDISSDKILEFDKVSFSCSADANPSDVHYSWYRDDKRVTGTHTTELTMPTVSRDMHSSVIKCEATNHIGTNAATHTLDIQYGPKFKSKPINHEAEAGSDVVLECDVDANPAPEITWTNKEDHFHKILATGSSYTISAIEPSMAGVYRCRATAVDFPEIYADMRVDIKGPPTIHSAAVQRGVLGDTVHVVCDIAAVPKKIGVEWVYSGIVINVDDPRYSLIEEPTARGLRSTLIIHKSADGDFGQYNCTAENGKGVDVMTITLLKEKGAPLLYILCGVILGAMTLSLITLIVFKRQRRRKAAQDGVSDKNSKPATTSSGTNGISTCDQLSNDSDMKVEIRTTSSQNSTEHESEWDDHPMSYRGPDSMFYGSRRNQNPYRYSDYMDPNIQVKEVQSNNVYNPARDNYGMPLSTSREPVYASHIDPRYSAAYGNPYLRNSVTSLPSHHHSLRHSNPMAGDGMAGQPGASVSLISSPYYPNPTTTIANNLRNGIPKINNLNNAQYITSAQPGALATHV